MANDPHKHQFSGGQQPAAYAEAVNISSTDHTPTKPIRGVVMDAVGALKVDLVEASAITFQSGMLAAGIIHPLQITKVYKTGTGTQNIKLLG